jgi:hypothetical protein
VLPPNNPPSDWLIRELRDGLRKLVSLSLETPPSADLIGATLLTWAEAITRGREFDAGRDAPRFRSAFCTLAERQRRWPAPADFLDALPRIQPERRPLRLIDDGKRQLGMAKLADIARKLNLPPEDGCREADATT